MRHIKCFKTVCSFLAMLTLCILQPVESKAGVCQEGLGLPPFLSSGADPNLLLLLDNSGSMLDMAYVGTVGECVDNSFDSTKTYTGLFDPARWYRWSEGTAQWRNGATYSLNDFVYSEGVFYRASAVTGFASDGAMISEDSQVIWEDAHEITTWTQGGIYNPKSFVQYDQQLYYTTLGGTANDADATDGISIDGDTGVADWEAVESTWKNGAVYGAYAVVSYKGMLFYTIAGGTANDPDITDNESIYDDTGVSWVRLDEGGFEADATFTSTIDAAAYFSGEDGTAHSQDDLYIKIVNEIDVNGVSRGSGVTGFAATGNLLNWASASKFDIQKEVLTGGKYDTENQNLVSQSRGCSSHSFVKEVPVDGDTKVITFTVNGTNDDSWIDTADDTTRITIMGVDDIGFILSDRYAACKRAIDDISAGEYSLGDTKQDIIDCLEYTDNTNNIAADMNAAFNSSMHSCWQKANMPYTVPADFKNESDIFEACERIYNNGVLPIAIDPSDTGYLCYGLYNQSLADARTPTGTGSDRIGYIGRCWETADIPVDCELVSCAPPTGTGGPDRCMTDGNLYHCSPPTNYNAAQGGKCTGQGQFIPYLVDNGDDDPTSPNYQGFDDTITCNTTYVATPGGWVTVENENPNDALGCVQEALWDYCQGLNVPEVIDPTDQIFITGDTWGMPGALVDSGIIGMFETDHALIVMKGYIKEPTPPQGILQEVSGDLRMGAMAFHDNGAAYECTKVDVNDNIINYCPGDNRDGARLIAPIDLGDTVTNDLGDADPDNDIHHVDDLVAAINDIRATAWTPLAEAVYSALGYYGQDSSRRIFDGPVDADFYTEVEDPLYKDPVQYWCQENYILIITEGASTADINDEVDFFVKTEMVAMTVEDTTTTAAAEGECLNEGLYGSTFLDDLTYFGQHAAAADLFVTPPANPGQLESDDGILHDKQNIKTYLVVTGNARDNKDPNDECNPATIMKNAAFNGGTDDALTGEDPAQLEANLRAALSDILFRASAGSASSVISSSRSGEGGVYQAVFWPKISRPEKLCDNNIPQEECIDQDPLAWTGDVHAFFIDENGLLWDDYSSNGTDGKVGELWTEDINGDGVLQDEEDWYPMVGDTPTKNSALDGDRRIVTYYNNAASATQICFNSSVIATGICAASDYLNTPPAPVDLRDFQYYIWSAQQQLSDPDLDILANRETDGDGLWDFPSITPRRYIFTWNDLDNDGIVDSDFNKDGSIDDSDGDGVPDREEILAFVPGMNSSFLDTTSAADPLEPRSSFINDFNVADNIKLDELIRWVRGEEIYESESSVFIPHVLSEDINDNGIQDTIYRCRKEENCSFSEASNNKTWRLGDIIHSTPTIVSRPAEKYHFPYKDPEYFDFYKKHVARRNVIYFGANDGMLHAVNGGFSQSETNKFSTCSSKQQETDLNCSIGSYPELGEELWAYIPYNLQPHLTCLSDPEYDHKYFVDAPPRIFDVRIFPPDSDVHIGGWGTILVGYMRFGGAPVDAHSDPNVDNRKFISSYFILDITDPERPPTLIAEMTMTNEGKYADLGYTTPMPTVVPMRNQKGNSEWFLVLGNGPDTIKGENSQQGKVAVISLNSLTGYTLDSPPAPGTTNNALYTTTPRKAFRIPNTEFDNSSNYYDSGILSIPADNNAVLESFVGDMVTVDFDLSIPSITDIGIPYKGDIVYFGTVDGTGFAPYFDGTSWNGTKWNGGGRLFRLVTNPGHDLNGEQYQKFTYPKDWQLMKLLDAQAPITAGPNIAFDGDNFWTYFGTGRFYAPEDKTDGTQQYFFGVKEPRDTSCEFTWDEVLWQSAGIPLSPDPAATFAGSRGLMRTDQIRVIESAAGLWSSNDDYVYCENDDGSGCSLPSSFPSLPIINLEDSNSNISSKSYYKFSDLVSFIKGERCGTTDNTTIGIDGWYRQLNDPRERSLGMPTLLGGLATFTTYQPFADICQTEGVGNLYGVYYLTGTAWYENVFGTYSNSESKSVVRDKLALGKGLATTPSLQVGSGQHDAKAFIQTSTGEIVEVTQDNLPIPTVQSGRTSWRNE